MEMLFKFYKAYSNVVISKVTRVLTNANLYTKLAFNIYLSIIANLVTGLTLIIEYLVDSSESIVFGSSS